MSKSAGIIERVPLAVVKRILRQAERDQAAKSAKFAASKNHRPNQGKTSQAAKRG
jgi:hypothetical protein